jgi:ABC-type nitrate/sulfonate/bicarbonate transport system substrate-binding protein
MKVRPIYALVMIIALALPPAAFGAQLRVSYPDIGPSSVFLWAARDRGYFAKQGLDVDLVYIAGGLLTLQALLGKNLDVAAVAGEIVVQNAARGGNIAIFGSFVNVLGYSLVVTKDINAITDLKNKTIGINRFGSSSEYFTRFILEEAGLDSSKDVTLIQTGGSSARLAALSAGGIRAALLTPPRDQTAVKMGMKILPIPKMEYLRNSLVTRLDFLDKNADGAQRFLEACRDAAAWLTDRKNKAEVLKLLKKYMRIGDGPELEYTYEFTVEGHQIDPRPSRQAVVNTLKLVRMMSPDLKDVDARRFLRLDIAEKIQGPSR